MCVLASSPIPSTRSRPFHPLLEPSHPQSQHRKSMPPPATAAAAARVRRRDDDADADVRAPEAPVLMEGPLRKQGARVHMWSPRYAVLRGSKLLMYRGTREEVAAVLRHPAAAAAAGRGAAAASRSSGASAGASSSDRAASPLPPPPPVHKREFVLMPGCYVSDVRELPGAAGKGRSLWEFRLHWCVGAFSWGWSWRWTELCGVDWGCIRLDRLTGPS